MLRQMEQYSEQPASASFPFYEKQFVPVGNEMKRSFPLQQIA